MRRRCSLGVCPGGTHRQRNDSGPRPPSSFFSSDMRTSPWPRSPRAPAFSADVLPLFADERDVLFADSDRLRICWPRRSAGPTLRSPVRGIGHGARRRRRGAAPRSPRTPFSAVRSSLGVLSCRSGAGQSSQPSHTHSPWSWFGEAASRRPPPCLRTSEWRCFELASTGGSTTPMGGT